VKRPNFFLLSKFPFSIYLYRKKSKFELLLLFLANLEFSDGFDPAVFISKGRREERAIPRYVVHKTREGKGEKMIKSISKSDF